MNEKINQTLKLRDGRLLGFAEYGNSDSEKTVIYFNGSGGSRLEYPIDKSILEDLDIRLVTTDRPGHGLSSPQSRRKLLDWPDDISQLADYLGVEKFYVLGWSAGGPHALACAFKLSERVIAGALFAGLAPNNRPNPYEGLTFPLKVINFIGRKIPFIAYIARMISYPMIKGDPKKGGEILVSVFPPEDRKIAALPEINQMLVKSIKTGFAQGWKGVAQDDIVINSNWGFDIENIKTRIDIWQGDKDKNVPLNQGKFQHEKIKNSTFTVLQNQAHLALLANWKNVLEKLTN